MNNYRYLNEDIINDYYAQINGIIPEEQTIKESSGNNKAASVNFGGSPIGIGAAIGGTAVCETTRIGNIPIQAKYKDICHFIAENETENGGIPFYEVLDQTAFDNIFRNDYIEIFGKARLSKMKSWEEATKLTQDLEQLFSPFSDKPLLDPDTKKEMEAFKSLTSGIQRGKTTLIVNVGNTNIPVIVELMNNFIMSDISELLEEISIMGKVKKKINLGEKYQIDSLLDQNIEQNMNRDMRRNLKKAKTPKDFSDIISGPALIMEAIAVYT